MFRDEILRCPECEGAFDKLGDRHVCGGCGSIFIESTAFEALLNELVPDDPRPVSLRIFPGTHPALSCPRCSTTMTPGTLYGFPLLACDTHGIWLEQTPFEAILHEHTVQYLRRTDENTPVVYLMAVPIFGVMAVPLQLIAVPLAKRMRMRKYLRQTTPPKKT